MIQGDGAPDFSLTDRVALITGSTQGLGWAIARAYAACGARVIVNGRDPNRVQAAITRLYDQGYAADPLVLDVSQFGAHESAFNEVCERVGVPDILVNNVGIRIRKTFAEASLAEIIELINTDLIAAIHLSKLSANAMVRKGTAGRIVTLTSIAGPLARRGDAIYPIAKQGLNGMVRALAVEYGPHSITSNGIAPGTFATETNASLVADPGRSAKVVGRNPLGRWGHPDEIAGAAVFLASRAASYVNGHVLVVDGGFSVVF